MIIKTLDFPHAFPGRRIIILYLSNSKSIFSFLGILIIMFHHSFSQACVLNSNSVLTKNCSQKYFSLDITCTKSLNFNLNVKRVNLYKLEWLLSFLKIFIKPTNLD